MNENLTAYVISDATKFFDVDFDGETTVFFLPTNKTLIECNKFWVKLSFYGPYDSEIPINSTTTLNQTYTVRFCIKTSLKLCAS